MTTRFRSTSREPNFLYIGTNKAGTTWLYAALSSHPDVYLAPGKGLHFFSSQYHRGGEWYRRQFANAGGQRAVKELSHSYLYSKDACERIARMIPHIKLVTCLREPVDRAWSDYLHAVKNGRLHCSFEQAVQRIPIFLERGRYATYLRPYMEKFDTEMIHVGVSDDLRTDANAFAASIFRFLGVGERLLQPGLCQRYMPAGEARFGSLTYAAKQAARTAKSLGFRRMVGRAKRSILIRNILFRQYREANKPTMRQKTRAAPKDYFYDEIRQLDDLLASDLRERWGYGTRRGTHSCRPPVSNRVSAGASTDTTKVVAAQFRSD